MTIDEDIARAAALVAAADGLLVTAGAGMGVDSGLPDFRGDAGFWRAYPALGAARIRFTAIANPDAFARDPRTAWGFYGHRLRLYRETVPHAGFAVLRRLAQRARHGAFVFTSNVDGQFQRAGLDPEHVCEVHGSIHHLQCAGPCGAALWPADDLEPAVDEANCRWLGELPACPHCGGLARPNILMFGDADWIDRRQRGQVARLEAWLAAARAPVTIELGAGTAVPTVRAFGERLGAPLVRINPDEPHVPRGGGVGIALGARAALEALEAALPAG